MSKSPLIPIELQIRKAIFENFNDIDLKFNNDQIFEIIQKNGDVLVTYRLFIDGKEFRRWTNRQLGGLRKGTTGTLSEKKSKSGGEVIRGKMP